MCFIFIVKLKCWNKIKILSFLRVIEKHLRMLCIEYMYSYYLYHKKYRLYIYNQTNTEIINESNNKLLWGFHCLKIINQIMGITVIMSL